MVTVVPKIALPVRAMAVTSITWALDRRPSISRIRASTIPCCSRAAWYSAFSLRSPSSRASAMASVICGRSTVFRCLSSSSRASAPCLVIGYFMSDSLVQFLKAAHCALRAEFQCHAYRLTAGQSGGGVHLVLQGIATNGIGVGDGLPAFGGIDYQPDLVVLDHIDDMRATFGDLVHTAHRQTSRLDDLGGTGGGHHFETEFGQVTGHVGDEGLVVLTHADEHGTRGRQHLAGAQLRLGKSLGETVANAHHLAGGLHFRPKDGIHTRELGEREDRFLYREERRNHLFGEAQLLQRLASHHPRSDLRQGAANALGDEGHGTRSPRIHFDYVDGVALQRQLHVHQTDHTQLQRHALDLVAHLVLNLGRQRVRRQRAGRVTGVHARLLDVLHDRTDDHIGAVGHRIHVNLDRAIEEVIQQHRAVIGYLHCVTQVALELVFLVDDLHGATAQYVGWAHDQRVADLVRGRDGLVFAAHSGVRRLTQVQALDHLLEALAVLGTVNGLGAGTDDRHASLFQGTSQLQRSLPAVLHDHTLGRFDTADIQPL